MESVKSSIKKLESDLYDDSLEDKLGPKLVLDRGITAFKNYILNPATHGGFYFAGVGWKVGGVGYFAYNFCNSLYYEGPEIINKLSRLEISGAIFHTGYLFLKSLWLGAYGAGVGGGIGYIGGHAATRKVVDAFMSFLGFKKGGE